jgi:hypothetical protein
MRYLPFIFLTAFAAGCTHHAGTMVSRYHEDGRAKPFVAIAPMLDTTSFDASWSLSEELTSMIVQKVAQSGEIFVQSAESNAFAENPFSGDLSWMKREFENKEFAVFLELVQHEAVPAAQDKRPQEVSSNLNMAIRMRVVDLRGNKPQVVLQEMVKESYFIPRTLLATDYSQVVWGSEDYQRTPMSIAHAQLVQEISNRISDYILLAKSR